MKSKCEIPAMTLPPCDLEWGHDGDMHANGGDGFYAEQHLDEHRHRQDERALEDARAAGRADAIASCEAVERAHQLVELTDLRSEVARLRSENGELRVALEQMKKVKSLLDFWPPPADLPSAEESVGIWYELECALEGKNGYGGDVAEIYAYRLLSGGATAIRDMMTTPSTEEEARVAEMHVACVAAKNLTWLVRRFVELHAGVEIGIETDPRQFHMIDPRAEEFPPFSHRVHVRVSRRAQVRRALAGELRAMWEGAKGTRAMLPEADFARWSFATKDLLAVLDDETSL